MSVLPPSRRRSARLRVRRPLGLTCLLLLALVLAWAPTSAVATPTDAASTRTYLQAFYQLERAYAGNAGASRSAVTALTRQLGRECGAVLAGAPTDEIEIGSRSEATPTARARGELQRSRLQLTTINEEVLHVVGTAAASPDRSAIQAFAARVTPLSWSDPQVAALVRFTVASLQEAAAPSVLEVCADMKSWAASGFHILSASSREFEEATKTRQASAPTGSLAALLTPYEGRSERALVRRTRALTIRFGNTLEAVLRGFPSLRQTLGLAPTPHEVEQRKPALARGKTAAGTTFIVRRETSEGSLGHICRGAVSVTFEETSANSSSSRTSGPICISGDLAHNRESGCEGDVESITAAVPTSVRTVRLTLSDGRTITSRVVRVPARDGGPGAIYAQAVRDRGTHPVSLTELDQDGDTVGVIQLGAARCMTKPSGPPTGPPTILTLATAATPQGETFTIEAYASRSGANKTTFGLIALDIGVQQDNGVQASEEGVVAGQPKPKAFQWELSSECPPHEFTILYGLLAAPGSSVLARTAAGLVPMTTVALAANLNAGGPLVYGVFSTLPSELVVLASDGSTLYSESLVASGKEQSEFCEGYAEG